MTENQETGLGQGEQGILDLCISGPTSEGAHAKMRSNAGQDEPQKVAMEARESPRVPKAREGVHANQDQGHTGSRRRWKSAPRKTRSSRN